MARRVGQIDHMNVPVVDRKIVGAEGLRFVVFVVTPPPGLLPV
jgi:hypothetical protein